LNHKYILYEILLGKRVKETKETKVRNATSGPNGPIFYECPLGRGESAYSLLCMCLWGRWRRSESRARPRRGKVWCGIGFGSGKGGVVEDGLG
jgi:hypothetical protein